jgi:hypothetical protein
MGIMAYEALTGDAPHRCETIAEVWEFATRGSLPRLPAGAPAQLAEFVELSVVRDAAARASAAALAALPFTPRATTSELELFLRSLKPTSPLVAEEPSEKLDQQLPAIV